MEVLESHVVPNVFFLLPPLAPDSVGLSFSVCRDGKKACVTCCGAGKGKSFCVQSTQEAGKVSFPNVTVWDLPGTNRQKMNIHMDAHNLRTHCGSRKLKNIYTFSCKQARVSHLLF